MCFWRNETIVVRLAGRNNNSHVHSTEQETGKGGKKLFSDGRRTK